MTVLRALHTSRAIPAASLLLALALAAPLAAQRQQGRDARPAAPAPDPAWAEFTRRFDTLADSERIVGASVLLMRDGRVVGRHHYGHADRAAGRRVDDATIFHWGSITKTLTGVAIMQLRDRGGLSLDDRVTRWIPELRQVSDPFGMLDSITVRMLLAHSSGFQGSTWPWRRGAEWEPFEPTSWEQLVAMMPYQRLGFRPGSRWSYSNPAYVYLARIVEKVTGDPWQSYVQKNIFSPLALSRSYFGVTPYHLAAERSHNYAVRRDTATRRDTTIDRGPDFDPGITIPNGGWNAPLEDLAGWFAFLAGTPRDSVTGRRFETVLARRTIDEMWRPVVPLPTSARAPADSMGLSFFVHQRGGARIIGHTGSQAEFRAFAYVSPATRGVVIVALNTTNATMPSTFPAMQELAWALLR